MQLYKFYKVTSGAGEKYYANFAIAVHEAANQHELELVRGQCITHILCGYTNTMHNNLWHIVSVEKVSVGTTLSEITKNKIYTILH